MAKTQRAHDYNGNMNEYLSFKQYMDIKGSQCTCKEGDTQLKTCGTYCKKTGPKQQRLIILDILRQESQTKEIRRYLINQRWWTSWCDYVNFEHKNAMSQDSSDFYYERPGRIANAGLLDAEVMKGQP